MEAGKLTSWSSWNRPLRPKILSPLAGGAGVISTHLLLLFHFGIEQSGLTGVAIYTLAAMVGFGGAWGDSDVRPCYR